MVTVLAPYEELLEVARPIAKRQNERKAKQAEYAARLDAVARGLADK